MTQIERALEHLDLVGPTVVVVQSPLALEEPDPDEASDAVIIELGELRAPVCAFVPEDQVVGAVVTCSLQLGEGGYKDQERLLIREGGSGGFHWVEGSD